MSDDTYKKLFESIRDFLKNEAETYGSFHVPEITPNNALDSDTISGSDSNNVSGTGTSSAISPSSVVSTTEDTLITPVNASTLEELHAICMKADVLKTDLENTNMVFGTGNPDADIMLIGEAPGAQEDKVGEPFVGKAGQLLNKILAAVSFYREEVYIANILKHRPPNNRDPLPQERDRSLPYLFRQIELIKPKWIVCLGRISAQTLLKTNKPMKALRGTFHPFQDNIELMVTFHPAALLRNPSWKRDTWEDVQMLRKRYDEMQQQ